MRSGRLTFPLVPRRRVIGTSFGTMRSLRRGSGSDVAGSRPYYPGDDMDAIDWAASARLSTARGRDEFVVRERFAEEAPRVIIVCDRRPQMAHFAWPLPWLDKPQAMRNAVELILASAGASGGYVGYLDYADGDPHWRQPKGERKLIEIQDDRLWSSEYGGPQDWLERSVAHLAEHRRAVSPGTFVFLLSDFLPAPSSEIWLVAFEHRWDLVPVVIQDPVWEQSFPDVSGIVVPLSDPESNRVSHVRLKRDEVAERRAANEERLLELLDGFRMLDIDPIVVSSSDKSDVLAPFLMWTELRRTRRVIGA
ncbi:MAG: DUF58 domain-containing protein [Actinobacteria bacterium]|nr:DUF58 domain-containing protein [Actinomycetota bacterium]